MMLAKLLETSGECRRAVEWMGGRSAAKVWAECPRGDWMLQLLGWMADQPNCPSREVVVLAACDCAELAQEYWRGPEPERTIQTVRAWAEGRATLEDVRKAGDAANDVLADPASGLAAGSVAYDATHAAAYAAAYAAADSDAVRDDMPRRCADLVRRRIPSIPD